MKRSLCPLTGLPGKLLRTREPEELFSSYFSSYGSPLPRNLFSKYFQSTVGEYYNSTSGLRWYDPAVLADGDFYATLASIYSWYYNPASWDKLTALEIITSLRPVGVAEIGCGDGW